MKHPSTFLKQLGRGAKEVVGQHYTCHEHKQAKNKDYTFATFAYRYSSDVNITANRCKQCCNYSEEHWQKYSSMDCCTGPQGFSGWVWRKENLSSTRVCTPKQPACGQLPYRILHPCSLWCKGQTFLLLPEEYVLWLNTLI